MKFEIEYQQEVIKVDIPAIDSAKKAIIKHAIEQKLTSNPGLFGKPLRNSLKNYRSLRVEHYRVIYRIEKNKVKIFKIGHRSTVYEKALKRILSL